MLVPEQMVVAPPMLGAGFGFTITCTLAVPVHVPLVTVTLYIVLAVGFTVIAAVVEPSLQLYVPPELDVKVVLLPVHIVLFPVMVGAKLLLTVTCTVAVPVQPLSLAVTVYVVVLAGDTVIADVVSPVSQL